MVPSNYDGRREEPPYQTDESVAYDAGYRRGAEEMRERAAQECLCQWCTRKCSPAHEDECLGCASARAIRALPIERIEQEGE